MKAVAAMIAFQKQGMMHGREMHADNFTVVLADVLFSSSSSSASSASSSFRLCFSVEGICKVSFQEPILMPKSIRT